jgi:hypothetical protein
MYSSRSHPSAKEMRRFRSASDSFAQLFDCLFESPCVREASKGPKSSGLSATLNRTTVVKKETKSR